MERFILARKFRLWEKKRGSRRTGSGFAGALGEGTFFASMLLIGFLAIIALVTSYLVPIPGAPHYAPGSGLWLGVVVSTSFILIGAGGLLFTFLNLGTSVERRTALRKGRRNWIRGQNDSLLIRIIPRCPDRIRSSSAPVRRSVTVCR